jgi:two-component system cell cycle response regulator
MIVSGAQDLCFVADTGFKEQTGMAMTSPLQSENYSLRQQLESLLHEARRNEEKMRRFDGLERRLIGAGSLPELVRLLLTEYQSAFNVEYVTLALVDAAPETSRLLEGEFGQEIEAGALILLQAAEGLEPLFGENPGPRLGAFVQRTHHLLFNAPLGAVASVALLPLIRQGRVMGSLNLGSTNPHRYESGCATDFLERLAEIVAVCLESALAREQLKMTGLTDGLTGVQNRRYFEHRLQEEVSQSRRHQQPLTCMFLDVDRFKRINDTHGHQTGDMVLREVAGAAQSQLRIGDTIARYGGEEFIVLLPRTSAHHGREIAERIRKAIEEQNFKSRAGYALSVTISIGLASLPLQGTSQNPQVLAEAMVAAADDALYQAKHTGRNRVVCAEEGEEAGRHADGAVLQVILDRMQGFHSAILALFSQTLRRFARI